MSYDDLKEYGSEAAVKAAGKLKQQGKTYESTSPSLVLPSCCWRSQSARTVVVDGDIAYWKAGA